MTAATANVLRMYKDGSEAQLDMVDEKIYRGIACSLESGYAAPLTAGEKFAGFSRFEEKDNSDGSDGDLEIKLDTDCKVRLAVTGASSNADVGKKVYATDDSTFTLTPGAPGGSTCIGKIKQHISSTTCVVHAYVGADDDADQLELCTVAPVATAGAATYTAAQLLGHMIIRDPAGGDRSDVSPTAALIVAALKDARVGSMIDFAIRNSADDTETITLTAGAGVTLSGTMTIAQNNTKLFRAVVTAVGTPAVTIYSLGTFVH